MIEMWKRVSVQFVEFLYGPKSVSLSARNRIVQIVEEGSGSVIPIGWRHFHPALRLFVIGLVAAIILLVAEKIKKNREPVLSVVVKKCPFVPTSELGWKTRRAHIWEREQAKYAILKARLRQEAKGKAFARQPAY